MKKTDTADLDALMGTLQTLLTAKDISVKEKLAISDRIIKLLAIRHRGGKPKAGGVYNPFASPEPPEGKTSDRDISRLI